MVIDALELSMFSLKSPFKPSFMLPIGFNDTQDNDIQLNGTQPDDTQNVAIQHSNKLNATLSIMTLDIECRK